MESKQTMRESESASDDPRAKSRQSRTPRTGTMLLAPLLPILLLASMRPLLERPKLFSTMTTSTASSIPSAHTEMSQDNTTITSPIVTTNPTINRTIALDPAALDSITSSTNETMHTSTSHNNTVHVLFGMSGAHKDFLAEFETALKSVLLNAPLDMDLQVHVLADGTAHSALGSIFEKAKLAGSKWRTNITINTYNVDQHIAKWKKQVAGLYHKKIGRVTRHTIGAYFRLFANEVLPDTVEHFIYMDTDVVIMANLADLWHRIDRNATFEWGKDHCSGFVVFNVQKLPTIWTLAKEFDFTKYASGDQFILKQVGKLHPEVVAFLPKEWAISIGNGLWRHAKTITTFRPKVGMFHFNGQGARKISYFKNKNGFIHKYSTTFGAALYYVNLPWSWARFNGESMAAGVEKHRLVLNHKSKKKSKKDTVDEPEMKLNATKTNEQEQSLDSVRSKAVTS